MNSPAPLASGTRIGPYTIVGWLGAGGMGVVYRARDPRLARDVAIKLIPESFAADDSRARRFEQEARAAGQLNHPNILAVYDVGLHAGVPYLVSELLEGESLRERLRGGALPPRKAIDYGRQIAEGLAAAHAQGIVHRDLKPDNLFVTSDGRVKILDFGIAKLTRRSDTPAAQPTGAATETEPGMVVGTAGYMSPEQVRGEEVDARSDLFSFGTILHEMLTGRPAFARATSADSMAAVLKEDPAERLANVSPGLERIISRCLEKAVNARFQSARDLAFALEVLSDTHPATAAERDNRRQLRRLMLALAIATIAGVATWLIGRVGQPPDENPLENARFTRFTDWEGTEGAAEISPDGRFVAFVSDHDGEFDVWLSQVGTGTFTNITRDIPPLTAPSNILRVVGFSGNGANIWFSVPGPAGAGAGKAFLSLTGGTPRSFLDDGSGSPAWSPDEQHLVYFKNGGGDPLLLADPIGADARPLAVDRPDFFATGLHNHNPIWSPDSQWIYFVHGQEPTETMNVWRVRRSGGTLEPLTDHRMPVNFMATLDARTLLYTSMAEDRSGPWLWSLDVVSKATRRVTSGLEHYSSVSASRDGRRIVATVSNPTADLWQVPIGDRLVEEGDVQPFALPTARALAPRFAGSTLFYLSSRGGGDSLWRFSEGAASEIWKAGDDSLSEPPAVSLDGNRVAIVVRQGDKQRLTIMSADGTNRRTLAESIDIQSSGGQGSADWSPDEQWIVVAASDAQGPGLFKIPVDGGSSIRLTSGPAVNPVWSPDGTLVIYGGAVVSGLVPLLGVKPDGTAVALPDVRARLGGGHRFLKDGRGLIYLPRISGADFWLLDFATNTTRPLTRLRNRGALHTFDVSPDGKSIVFDRSRENSDIALIELPK